MFRAALSACGIPPAERGHYRDMRDAVVAAVRRRLPSTASPRATAEALFTCLWEGKPHRYQSGGPFKLSEVLEAQVHLQTLQVGNCLGLTLLYTCLATSLGLKVGGVHLEAAFGMGPHVLTLLHLPEGPLDVENILRQGFGYQGHPAAPVRQVWGARELLADLHHSLGNECFHNGDYVNAVACYRRALALYPAYEKARLNLGQALAAVGRPEEAERVFAEA